QRLRSLDRLWQLRAGRQRFGQRHAGQVEAVAVPGVDLVGDRALTDPEPDLVPGTHQMGAERGAPRAAAEHGQPHGQGPPSRGSVPRATRARLPRCFQTINAARPEAVSATGRDAPSSAAPTASATAPLTE